MTAQIIPLAPIVTNSACQMALDARMHATRSHDVLKAMFEASGDMTFAARAELVRAAANGDLNSAVMALQLWRTAG